MKKEHEHETFAEKFWDWWDYTDLGELFIGALLVLFALFIITGIIALICVIVNLRPADDLPPEEPAEGVAWIMPESGEAAVWLSPVCADEAETARMLDEYTEGDAPVPAWWAPDEPMAVEWYEAEPHPPVGIDQGGIDYNLCSTVWGWDGHGAEIWEMDLLSRIFYLEFWQPDMMLCEAGCDAILRLWETGEKGRTLGEVLSSRNEDGSWTYSVYPDIWTTDYDEDGLAWCRDYTAERFAEGPVWIAPYFRLDHYHDWAVPAYQIGNVYFSVGGER